MFLLNAAPSKQGSKLDKKGFCKANLTKQTYFGQETLTGIGQETLTNLTYDVIKKSMFFKIDFDS